MGKFSDFIWAILDEMAVVSRAGIEVSTPENLEMLSKTPRRAWSKAMGDKYNTTAANGARMINRWFWRSMGFPKESLNKNGRPDLSGISELEKEQWVERFRNATVADFQPNTGVTFSPNYRQRSIYSYDDPREQQQAMDKLARAIGLNGSSGLDEFIYNTIYNSTFASFYGAKLSHEQATEIVGEVKQQIIDNLQRFEPGNEKYLPPEYFKRFILNCVQNAGRKRYGWGDRKSGYWKKAPVGSQNMPEMLPSMPVPTNPDSSQPQPKTIRAKRSAKPISSTTATPGDDWYDQFSQSPTPRSTPVSNVNPIIAQVQKALGGLRSRQQGNTPTTGDPDWIRQDGWLDDETPNPIGKVPSKTQSATSQKDPNWVNNFFWDKFQKRA